MLKYEQIQQILQNERLMGLLKISHESLRKERLGQKEVFLTVEDECTTWL